MLRLASDADVHGGILRGLRRRLPDMVGFAYQRVSNGEPVPGLIATTNEQSIDSAIDDIVLVAEYSSEKEMKDQIVVFLPLRE